LVLFGKGSELLLAHWISVAPNYDQVVVVSPTASIGDIPPGVVFTLLGRNDAKRLRAGESVSGVMIAGQGPEEPFLIKRVDFKVSSEFYFEEGELTQDDLPPIS
jgi:hypothetical protein